MESFTTLLATPSSWCDGRCERCPRQLECDERQLPEPRMQASTPEGAAIGRQAFALGKAAYRELRPSLTAGRAEAISIAQHAAMLALRLHDVLPLDPRSAHATSTAAALLTLEHLLTQWRSLTSALAIESPVLDTLTEQLTRSLAPHLRAVPPEIRRTLPHLIRRAEAPSPFCTLTPRAPSAERD